MKSYFPPSNGWCAKILFGVTSHPFGTPFWRVQVWSFVFFLKRNQGSKSPTSKFFLATKAFPKVLEPEDNGHDEAEGFAKVWHWMKLRPGVTTGGSYSSLQQGVNVVCQLYLLNKKHRGVTTKRPQDLYI